MIAFIKPLLFRFGPYLVAFVLGFVAAQYIGNKIEAKQAEKALAEQEAEYEAILSRALLEFNRMRRADEAIRTDLEKKLAISRNDRAEAEAEVFKYVEDLRSCDLSRGAVRLLNNARGARALPGAAELPDEEARAPSTVTQRVEVTAHADCAIRYRNLATQHNALIEWLEQQNNKAGE